MKHMLVAVLLATAAASAQSGRTLPPDIDARSYSRLPLIPKDSLSAEGRRVFEAINGKDASEHLYACVWFGPAICSVSRR